jgi:OPT family small oligopeptide transporter
VRQQEGKVQFLLEEEQGGFQAHVSPAKEKLLQSPHSLNFGHPEEQWGESVAPCRDDPRTPDLTFRSFLLGTIWSIFLSIANTTFSFRKNHVHIPHSVVVLLSYPMGIFLEVLLPDWTILGIRLNPGKFSVKEHVLISLMAGAGGSRPHGIDNVVVQSSEMYLNDKTVNFWNSLAWILSSQLIGFGLAGIYRDILVKPVSMIWPHALPDVALFTSFHKQPTSAGEDTPNRMSRETFFWIAFGGMFVYQWIPTYFASAFALVAILCLVSTNRTVRFLGSGDAFEGPGILGLSFDWPVIAHHNPLTSPFWVSVNYAFQGIFWGWIIIPWIHFANPFNAPVLEARHGWGNRTAQEDPFPNLNTNMLYDKFGNVAKIASFVNLPSMSLNREAFEERQPFYFSASMAIGYFCSFMNVAAVLSHVALWYGVDIWTQIRETFGRLPEHEWDDIHNYLMKRYKDVHNKVYLGWFLAFIVIQLLVCSFTPFRMPVWVTLLAIAIGGFLVLPIGIISAISGSRVGINVLMELIVGYLLPGDVVAVMAFKALGTTVLIQCLFLIKDLKLAHYMHISPVKVILSQLWGTIIGSVISTGTTFWVLKFFGEQLKDIGGVWSATVYRSFAMAGMVWGSIGPKLFFHSDAGYYVLLYGFLIGFFLPFLPRLGDYLYPSKYWILINFPILTLGVSHGTNQANVVVPFILAYIFNYWIFRKHRGWWDHYNFILACAISSGSAISILIIIFWRNVGSDGSLPLNPLNGLGSVDYYCRGAPYDLMN